MLSRCAVGFVSADVEHLGNNLPCLPWRTRTRVGIATLSEIAKHGSRGFLAPVRPHQTEGALPYRSRYRRAIEETGGVGSVTPRVRPRRADLHQPAQNCVVVVGRFFFGRQVL